MSHDPILNQIRDLSAGLVSAQREAMRCRDGLNTAVKRAIRSEFGGPHPSDWIATIHGVASMRVGYDYRPDCGWWAKCVTGNGKYEVIRFADNPRAAVTAALDALALTHPNEAAALAAVIPSEAP